MAEAINHLEDFRAIPWCAARINNPDYSPVHIRPATGQFMTTLYHNNGILSRVQLVKKPDITQTPEIQEVLTFFSIGPGVSGHPGVCHGGFTAALLDNQAGHLIYLNHEFSKEKLGLTGPVQHMTVSLDLKYLAPVKTPSIILVSARVVRSEGRKFVLKATIEDESGKILVTADAFFIKPREMGASI
jgi:thioesterase superfamily protein 4